MDNSFEKCDRSDQEFEPFIAERRFLLTISSSQAYPITDYATPRKEFAPDTLMFFHFHSRSTNIDPMDIYLLRDIA